MRMYKIIIPLFGCLLFSCSSPEQKSSENHSSDPLLKSELADSTSDDLIQVEDTCQLEKDLIASGLVCVNSMCPAIKVDLRYSDTLNLVGEDMYGDLSRLYLHPEAAKKLCKAQELLFKEDSTLHLLVYDGVRPRRVQQMLWDKVDLPPSQKGKFVSNPKNTSLHNYGCAVDITIVRENGEVLDMGTNYDDTAILAHPDLEVFFLKEKQLTETHIQNRKLLRKVMQGAGFFGISSEWWHFNACTREFARANYKVIE